MSGSPPPPFFDGAPNSGRTLHCVPKLSRESDDSAGVRIEGRWLEGGGGVADGPELFEARAAALVLALVVQRNGERECVLVLMREEKKRCRVTWKNGKCDRWGKRVE